MPVRLLAVVWLATYIVCIGLVCSFILFEVLDIDGSDFPVPASNVATPIKLAEPAHEFKRAWLTAATQPSLLLPSALLAGVATALLRPTRTARPAPQPGSRGRRGSRLSLPRASLADAAPTA